MQVLVTGATGFIGRALIPLLQREGHSVVAWVRSEARARSLLGADVEMVRADAGLDGLVPAIERCDAVVNLAGEPLLGGRWTAARRAALESSRVEVTDLLVRAIAKARTRPGVLVSGSAVGYYGNRADERLDEASSGGDDILARLCRRWESAAQSAESLGVRVALLRTGVVLGRAGGALAQMQPPFELGLGGPLGSGRQYMPWIHLHDLVKIIGVALVDERYRGPVNGVAPEQATSRSFARALGLALNRPAIFPLPALALRLIFGQAATVLLASQRVAPRALESAPVRIRFSDLGRGARRHRRGRLRHDLAGAVAAPRSRGGSLRAAHQDDRPCADRRDIRVLLEGREPRPDHAGGDGILHPGTRTADGPGGEDRLSRPRRRAARSMAHAYHHLGARPTLCRSAGSRTVPRLVARTFVRGRRRAHGDGGSRLLRAAARRPGPARASSLHRPDAQEDLSVPEAT